MCVRVQVHCPLHTYIVPPSCKSYDPTIPHEMHVVTVVML